MLIKILRSVSLLAGVALSAAGLGAVSGCGSQQEVSRDTKMQAQRAKQVAEAWDGSAAAAAWRDGFHPMSDVTQLPRGGLRSKADRQAYQDHSFVLEGKLPGTTHKAGRVTWDDDGTLTRPLRGADEAYKILTGGARVDDGTPHLTVTGASLGEMNLSTARGPAVVPAWLFNLRGYASPSSRPQSFRRPSLSRRWGRARTSPDTHSTGWFK